MLNHKLSLENWHSGYKAITVDETYDNFFDIFMMHYNTSCPIVKVVHKSEKLNKPWLTKSLRNACIKKNKHHTKFLNNPKSDKNNKYKAYKNKLTSIIRSCERLHYSKLIENTK